MSATIIDAEARFARRIALAAQALARREAIVRARHAILPRPLVPANGAAPHAA